MTDRTRTPWCWDRVWLGCGKRDDPSAGPLCATHRAILDHLGLVDPEILSVTHGVLPAVAVTPYESMLDADHRRRFDALVLREVEQLVDEVLRSRSRVSGEPDEYFTRRPDGTWPPPRSGPAFGPPQQPSILVLAGADYVDGWVDRAEALGVRVDDPLRGMTLGERQSFAQRFVAETPSWCDLSAWEHSEHPCGYGSRREQLLGFVAGDDLADLLADLPGPEPLEPQLELGLAPPASPPTCPAARPARPARAPAAPPNPARHAAAQAPAQGLLIGGPCA